MAKIATFIWGQIVLISAKMIRQNAQLQGRVYRRADGYMHARTDGQTGENLFLHFQFIHVNNFHSKNVLGVLGAPTKIHSLNFVEPQME